MLKKLLFVTLATGSMMIASAQTPQAQPTPKTSEATVKHAPAKAEHKAKKDATHKAKASGKHSAKKAEKEAKGTM